MIASLLIAAAVAAAPADPATLSDAARAIEAGRLEQARAMIGRAVAAGAGGPSIDRLLADLAFASGKDAEARALSTDAADVNVAREAIESGAALAAPPSAAPEVAAAPLPAIPAAPAPTMRELPPDLTPAEVAREAAEAAEAALSAVTAQR